MSFSSQTCTTSSVVSTGISITFGIIYGLILISISLYSYLFVMKYNIKFQVAKLSKKLRLWLMDIYKRRRCYLPIITHLADKVTDIAVVIQFGQLAANKSPHDCGQLNMYYLFGLSIFVLLFYSIISSFLIYQSTKSVYRLIIQFLDFELFRALYINYLCDKNEPCSPQRWITSLEAAFESTPQALIQTIYLVRTQSFGGSNWIVVVSLIFSLWSIISKIISDDRTNSIPKAKHFNLLFNLKKCRFCRCFSWSFIARYIWRILDVSSRILITSLIWLALGGWYLSIILILEMIILLICCITTKRWEFLFGIVAIVISKSTEKSKTLCIGLIIYRSITNGIFMSVITLFVYASNIDNCWKCTTFQERQQFIIMDNIIFTIFVYCWICIVLTPALSIFLYIVVFKGIKSNARSIKDMIRSQDWNGIIEMQAYKGEYGVFNEKTNENLLMIAIQYNYGKLVKHLFCGNKVDLTQINNKNQCVLEYIKLSDRKNDKNTKNKEYLGELLIDIAEKHPNMKTQSNEDPLLLSCWIGDVSSCKYLINKNQFDTSNAWKYAIDGDQPEIVDYFLNDNIQNGPIIPNYTNNQHEFVKTMISNKKPNILDYLLKQNTYSMDEKELWFYVVNNGDVRTIRTTQKYVKNINMTDDSGCTVLHIACKKTESERDMNIINYLERAVNVNITDAVGRTAMEYLKKLAISDKTEYKITMLGSSAAQSALTIRFITGTYEANYDQTIEDSYRKQVSIDDHPCLLDILDTAGQEQYAALQNQWIREGDIFIILYSITSKEQFEETEMIRGKIIRILDLDPDYPLVPIVLVGMKCDLEEERVVSTEQGQELCKQWGDGCAFFEASAKEKINIDAPYFEGVRLYWKLNNYE